MIIFNDSMSNNTLGAIMVKNWERARTEEQKEIREEEIFHAAKTLLLEHGFAEVTLSEIANSVSFSRANLYKYYDSTQNIYLALLGREMLNFSFLFLEKAKRKKSTHTKKADVIEEFVRDWVIITEKQACLRLLLSISTTILERNCTEEVFIESKKASTVATITLSEGISYYFPKLTDPQTSDFVTFLMITLSGLTTSSGLTQEQKRTLKKEGMGIMAWEYKPIYTKLIREYLS
jgi:AcrR family transcriptional regulator